MKKVLAMLILACMLLPVLVACTGDGQEAQTTGAEVTTTEETSPLAEADPAWVGKQYNIIYRETYEHEWVYVEENAGSLINDSIYARNMAVQDLYGIELVLNPVPTASFENDFLLPITNSVMSGDDEYQLAAGYSYRLARNSTSGNFLDWYSMPNVNIDGEWWDRGFAEAGSYKNHTYIMTGSLSLSHLYSASCVFFNQTIIDNNFANEGGAAGVYKLVEDGEWTYEAFYNYVKKCTSDIGDSGMDENDAYGYASNDTTAVDAFMFGFDIPISTRTAKGKIKIAPVDENEKLIETARLLNELFNTSGYTYNQSTSTVTGLDVHYGMMIKGNTAFTTSYLETATKLRQTEINYGIIPYPKWDKEQESYYSNNMDFATAFAIPSTVVDKEMVGAITDALAYYSYEYVREALYGTVLKYRDAKDDSSSKCIDIILNNMKYDFAYIYAGAWGDVQGPSSLLRICVRGKNAYIAAGYASNKNRYNNTLNKFLENFE